MTATANETAVTVEVDVRFNPTGRPLAVRYDGRLWVITEEPMHWFERDASLWVIHRYHCRGSYPQRLPISSRG